MSADILTGNPNMMESLLRASRAFVQECLASNVVAITYSIFPCFNWLLSTNLYSDAELAKFNVELEQILEPLNPLIIYLDAEPTIALERAVEQWGEQWLHGLTVALNSYAVNQEYPLQTFGNVASYFRTQARFTLDMLRQWSIDLMVVDAVQTPIEQLKASILICLSLSEKTGSTSVSVDTLASYVGVYKAVDDVPLTNPLVIGLEDGRLHVNTYWPNGSPLVAESDTQLRLENTSHRICFEVQADGSPCALTYDTGGKIYGYGKSAEPG